ncbi:chromosome segregation protein SMC [Candidatus Woesearchaeota archaeon CG08_land_8_20_14_0_20_47_9]|nr:MAG: chromosome segregation protein SMC [Candidatus Woesearchaeota archaeon CG1_02_47_18]PIO04442.1 MAG: chromosome segregation protein SMC [Candidatus Woesearchaeota archaeon CG08_land_8_20_14_0_20_47_9]HII29930.1 chromosome segregation protein SMC [Candidatus Woesearchaeota archaeon]
MTLIQKLVLSGFKSFARKTEIDFSQGFNVVLGPNGSGKSNIIDAVCFVLGRISSKGMRADKAAHLIYNGGKSREPAKKAEVSIFFDNSKGIFPTHEQTVKLTRTVKESGQSSYRINDKRVTRQQLVDMLASAKIDPNGYNIILQGDIVRFVEMTSIERRQVIEEIAGISVYEDKKRKALAELDKVGEKLREAAILLVERNTHLKELKKDRDQALKYRGISDNIKRCKATYLHMQIKRKESQKKEVDSSVKEMEGEIRAYKAEIERLSKKVEAGKKELARITAEIEQKGEKEQVKLHKEIETLKVGLATSESRLSTCDAELAKIKQRREQLKADFSDIENRLSELEKQRQDLMAQQKRRLNEQEGVERAIEGIKKKSGAEDLSSIESEVNDIEISLEEKQGDIQNLREEQQSLLRQKDKLEFQIEQIDQSVTKLSEIEKANKGELDKLKERKAEFKKTVLELNKALSQDSELAVRIANSKKQLASAREELAKLQARAVGIREKAAGDLAVKAVLEHKTFLRGIYGTVSELGGVKSKYALALEIAAGARIKSIVVSTDDVAARCIDLLKKRRIGTASFLPLNKLRPHDVKPEVKRLAKASGVVGLARELVSFEQRFSKVFSYVFGDTLVVDNIDVARRIGIGKARMVTLEGDMMELSGAMHGGYRNPKRAGMGFMEEETTQTLVEYEGKVSELEGLISSSEKTRAELEDEINRLRKAKADLEGEIIKMERSLHLDTTDLDVSKKQKSLLKEDVKKVDADLKIVYSKINSHNRGLTELKTRREKLRTRISELRNPAVIAELNAFEQKRHELTDALLRIENEIKAIRLQSDDMLAAEKGKIEKILKQMDKEELDFTAEKAQLKKSLKEGASKLVEMEKNAVEFYTKYRALFKKRDDVALEMQKHEERIVRKEEQSLALEQRINNLALRNAEISSEFAAMQKEAEQYSGVKLLQGKDEEELRKELAKHEGFLSQIGSVNLKALEVYEEVEKQYNELMEKKNKLEAEKLDVHEMIDKIEGKKKELFMNTFNVIAENFRTIFRSLTSKGDAYLLVENNEQPFEGGVRILVKLKGSKFLDIRSLSGGEKTLTALALIFSIQEHEPASFYVFDEVDAALDKSNSEKLAVLIKKYASNAQYVVISHNDAIVSEADTLFGISMNEHSVSNVVSLKL